MVFQGAMNALNPVQPGRRPDRGADRGPAGAAPRGGAQAGRRAARPRRDPQAAGRRVPARAVGRHAPAGDDRDGARVRPGDRHRRRADDGPRRHGPGADPPAARAAPPRPRAVADAHHPRPVGDRGDVRPGDDHVRGQGRRGGPGLAAVHRAAPPVHEEAALVVPQHPRRPADARRHPGRAAGPAQPAAGLPVRAPLLVRDGRLPRGRPARGPVLGRRPGRLPPVSDAGHRGAGRGVASDGAARGRPAADPIHEPAQGVVAPGAPGTTA